MALVGLYTKFADLALVGEQITLGRLLIVAPALVAAYAVTRPRIVAGERRPVPLRSGLAAGAVSALVGGVTFAIAVAFADRFGVDRIREVFVAVTEELIDFLTFGKGVPGGLVILVGLCVVGGVDRRVRPHGARQPPQARLGRGARGGAARAPAADRPDRASWSSASRRTGSTDAGAG